MDAQPNELARRDHDPKRLHSKAVEARRIIQECAPNGRDCILLVRQTFAEPVPAAGRTSRGANNMSSGAGDVSSGAGTRQEVRLTRQVVRVTRRAAHRSAGFCALQLAVDGKHDARAAMESLVPEKADVLCDACLDSRDGR